ncbi:hypothetical protein WG902_05975 [Ramlibacter sp. PS3R-8]|uniref:hypothetical protein n=1 Tax=Ramlibacter sp. PS3R-8 TaxID=3133437 RepID=UPI00309F3670
MKAKLLLLGAAALLAVPAFAQSDAQCIVAGRLSDGAWAPRLAGVQLLGAKGQALAGSARNAIASAKQVRLSQPALLSSCNGVQPLLSADGEPAGRKTEVPALSAGVLDVDGVSFLKLRTGGELVEVRVRAPAQRVVMLTR